VAPSLGRGNRSGQTRTINLIVFLQAQVVAGKLIVYLLRFNALNQARAKQTLRVASDTEGLASTLEAQLLFTQILRLLMAVVLKSLPTRSSTQKHTAAKVPYFLLLQIGLLTPEPEFHYT
jgi:hypothetical protein